MKLLFLLLLLDYTLERNTCPNTMKSRNLGAFQSYDKASFEFTACNDES